MSMAIVTAACRFLAEVAEAVRETRRLQAESQQRYPGLMASE